MFATETSSPSLDIFVLFLFLLRLFVKTMKDWKTTAEIPDFRDKFLLQSAAGD